MDSDIPDRNDVAFFRFDYYELLHAIALHQKPSSPDYAASGYIRATLVLGTP